MTAAAESGYTALRPAAAPFGPYSIAFLRFIFGAKAPGAPPAPAAQNNDLAMAAAIASPKGGLEWVVHYITLGLVSLFVMVAVLGAGYLAYRLIGKLMQKQSAEAHGAQPPFFLIRLMQQPWNFFWKLLQRWHPGIPTAREGFANLSRWGRKSGLPRQRSETASEYQKRLASRFYPLKNEISCVVNAFNDEIYGEQPLTRETLQRVKNSLKKMRHPGFWPLRVKSIFMGGN